MWPSSVAGPGHRSGCGRSLELSLPRGWPTWSSLTLGHTTPQRPGVQSHRQPPRRRFAGHPYQRGGLRPGGPRPRGHVRTGRLPATNPLGPATRRSSCEGADRRTELRQVRCHAAVSLNVAAPMAPFTEALKQHPDMRPTMIRKTSVRWEPFWTARFRTRFLDEGRRTLWAPGPGVPRPPRRGVRQGDDRPARARPGIRTGTVSYRCHVRHLADSPHRPRQRRPGLR